MTFPKVALVVLAATLMYAPLGAQEPRKKTEIVLEGSLQASDSVRLFTRVPGFVKLMRVDVGARVKKGELLAALDVPELQAQVDIEEAGLQKEERHFLRTEAAIQTSQADLDALKGLLKQAEANLRGAAIAVHAREREFKQVKELHAKRTASDADLADRAERLDLARAAVEAAQAGVAVAKAKVSVGEGTVLQMERELFVQKTAIRMAEAKLKRAKVVAEFASVFAPFDGVITQRNVTAGDLVRLDLPDAKPLLTIERVDVLRLIATLPERDIASVEPGSVATVEVHAFPGKKWEAKVFRIAASVDVNRTVRVELELPNPTGQLRSGMTATATIKLAK